MPEHDFNDPEPGIGPAGWQAEDFGQALAVPLDVAARLLGRPLPELEHAGVEPYTHADGTPFWSLHQLARALGLVESRETREARRRGRARERAAS